MTRKILISPSERTFIVSALMAYDASGVAEDFNRRFENAGPHSCGILALNGCPPGCPADDGPEVEILSVGRNAQ